MAPSVALALVTIALVVVKVTADVSPAETEPRQHYWGASAGDLSDDTLFTHLFANGEEEKTAGVDAFFRESFERKPHLIHRHEGLPLDDVRQAGLSL